MELTLNVKDSSGNAKTYCTDTIDCRFGIVEDILEVLDFDKISDTRQLTVMVLRSAGQLKPFLKDLFEGLTDEELRTARMSNIVEIFKSIYKYAVDELVNVGKQGN